MDDGVTLFPNCRLHAVLDYFWLETNYYQTRYGGHWVTANKNEGQFQGSKVWALIEMGFNEVSLPYDGGTRNESNSHMKEVLGSLNTLQRYNYRCIPAKREPLWLATESEYANEILNQESRGDHQYQTKSYLPKDTTCQFVVFGGSIGVQDNGEPKWYLDSSRLRGWRDRIPFEWGSVKVNDSLCYGLRANGPYNGRFLQRNKSPQTIEFKDVIIVNESPGTDLVL
jgi:hypothetical protein